MDTVYCKILVLKLMKYGLDKQTGELKLAEQAGPAGDLWQEV